MNILKITYKIEDNENSIGFYLNNMAIGGIWGRDIADVIEEHIGVLEKHYTWDKIEVEQAVVDYCNRNNQKLNFDYIII